MRPKKLPRKIREYVEKRAAGFCEYCQYPLEYSHDAFHVEHIIPFKSGGSNELDNLAFSCDGCNTNKGTRISLVDAQSGEVFQLYDPRRQVWTEHFAWSKDFTEVIGLTPTGRITIATLQLNRPGLVKIRHVLAKYGVHPPQ